VSVDTVGMHSGSIFANRHSARNRIYWYHIPKRAVSRSADSRHYGCISFSFNSPTIAAGGWSISPYILNEHSHRHLRNSHYVLYLHHRSEFFCYFVQLTF